MSTAEQAQDFLLRNRPDLAEKAARAALSEDPDDAAAHEALTGAFIAQARWDDALASAETLLRYEADRSWPFLARALALLNLDRVREADTSVQAAMALAPDAAGVHLMRSHVLLAKSKAQDALIAADHALSLDPELLEAGDARAAALRALGRYDEAEAQVRANLQRDPEHDPSHVELGILSVLRGRGRSGVASFREALRLDPHDEQARAGLLVAAKVRNPLYYAIFRFGAWMERFGRGAQIALGLALYFTARSVGRAAFESSGPKSVLLWAIVGVLAFLLFYGWIADPLGDLILRLTRSDLRHVIDDEERRVSTLFGIAFFGALLSAAAAIAGAPVGAAAATFGIAAIGVGVWSRQRSLKLLLGAFLVLGVAIAVIGAGGRVVVGGDHWEPVMWVGCFCCILPTALGTWSAAR